MSKHGGIEKSFNNNGYLYSRVTRRLRADTRDYGEVRVNVTALRIDNPYRGRLGWGGGVRGLMCRDGRMPERCPSSGLREPFLA